MQEIGTAQAFVRDNVFDPSIDQLKSFCRGEMSAVETYHQAIEVTREEWVRAQLRRNLTSHEERVRFLSRRITELGGEPPEGSGAWGTLTTAVEGVASAISESSALAILEEGERHGLADYKSDLSNLDLESRRLVSTFIIPQQAQTHQSLHEIVHTLSA